jgi:mRNA interferase MazF
MMAKVRPCVVVSAPIGDEDRAVITLVPHTTSGRATQYESAVPVRFLKPGAFDAQGIVTMQPRAAMHRLGTLTPEQMHEVEIVMRRWLQLPL